MAQTFPSLPISQSSTKTRKNRILVAQFGQGFGQYANDGPNANYDQWSLQLQNLTSDQRDTFNTFYNIVGVVQWFYFTAPGDSVQKKWRIEKDSVSEIALSGNLYTIRLTIVQQFDLGL